MLTSYFIPLINISNSSSSNSQFPVASLPKCTQPEYDPEDREAEGILCARCAVDHGLCDEVVRAGMTERFKREVTLWLFGRCDERKANISEGGFNFPLSLLGWENEHMKPLVDKAAATYKELKEQERLKEKGFRERRVETSPLRCEFCKKGQDGYVYEFGEDVVREVIRQSTERLRDVEKEEGIAVGGCRWSRGGSYCSAPACLAKEAGREAKETGASKKRNV
jgi:hypothetical protein